MLWRTEQGLSIRNGAEWFALGVVLGILPTRAINSVVDVQRGCISEALCPSRVKTRIGNVLILSGIVLLWQANRLDNLISLPLKKIKRKVYSLSQCYSTRNPTLKKKKKANSDFIKKHTKDKGGPKEIFSLAHTV